MKTARLLLVEDDKSLGATLESRLDREGYQVGWAKNLSGAREILAKDTPDLVILDIGLPDGSGFDLATEIAMKAQKPPFLFLTALAGAPERLKGFELGAEEFIPKPFHLKELLLRIQHVLDAHRHVHASISSGHKIYFSHWCIDFASFTIQRQEQQAQKIAARDMGLLKLLISERHRAVSRDEILDKLWGEENFPTNRTIDNAIVRLRQVFADAEEVAITSIRGVGYQWTGKIQD